MNAPTLFDAVGSRPAEVTGSTETGHGRGVAAPPTARHSDPRTSHEAAKKMESGNGPLMREIRFVVERIGYPADAFAIAGWVEQRQPGRWKEGSVRSAVSRAPFLKWVDNLGEVPDTKNACRRYVIKDGA